MRPVAFPGAPKAGRNSPPGASRSTCGTRTTVQTAPLGGKFFSSETGQYQRLLVLVRRFKVPPWPLFYSPDRGMTMGGRHALLSQLEEGLLRDRPFEGIAAVASQSTETARFFRDHNSAVGCRIDTPDPARGAVQVLLRTILGEDRKSQHAIARAGRIATLGEPRAAPFLPGLNSTANLPNELAVSR
jgi:hypothetical protein